MYYKYQTVHPLQTSLSIIYLFFFFLMIRKDYIIIKSELCQELPKRLDISF